MKARTSTALGEPGDGHLGLGDAAVSAGPGLGGDRLDDRRRVGRPAVRAAAARAGGRRRAVARTSGGPASTTGRRRGSRVAWTWFSEAPSPTAKVAAAAPNAIAATIVADRSGRANGWARPRVTGRGSGSRRGQPGRPLAAAGPRGAPDGEHVDGAQPAGPRRRGPGGHGHQRQRPGEHHARRPTGRRRSRTCRRPGWSAPGSGWSGGCRRRRRARRRPRRGSAPGPM